MEGRRLHIITLIKYTLTTLRSRTEQLMETKLVKIAEIAKEKPKERFTSLYHYLNKEMLLKCRKELSGNKATGIDEVIKAQYAENLEDNIESLVERLKNHSYKPQAVKRVYISKSDGKSKRPLGIP